MPSIIAMRLFQFSTARFASSANQLSIPDIQQSHAQLMSK